MSATSVTGKGLGMSNGKHKPELQCGGCGCGKPGDPIPAEPPTKTGCYTRIKSGGSVTYKKSYSTSTRVCS